MHVYVGSCYYLGVTCKTYLAWLCCIPYLYEEQTGQFLFDEDVLKQNSIMDMDKYAYASGGCGFNLVRQEVVDFPLVS